MSNGHQQAPTSVKDIVSAVFQAGALDQAPQEKPLTVGEIVSSAFNRERQFTPTIEPGVRGFGKGVLKGIVGPARIFGVDPDLAQVLLLATTGHTDQRGENNGSDYHPANN